MTDNPVVALGLMRACPGRRGHQRLALRSTTTIIHHRQEHGRPG